MQVTLSDDLGDDGCLGVVLSDEYGESIYDAIMRGAKRCCDRVAV